ncbi:hypothetical protein TVAG_118370 [Trichomonas vaginalis G3]|uniref:Uncharacterized protein n=1 Tax=Trichomonas vaginalis (strain ATCC PRA-98 / G3) TaxID=412133 RepID=A2EAU0_TRIV3|nr:protein serine/threonine kinase protein [Trichomonas vaginalis G3]EAY10185.1 hypothetical protein TVAG_118370 [Trichomonas vaginalis G3]KAI5513610.1 protein serine/threonine kinase protein [Trichomonas vaginalis G3]|eukprot:XP_001322408.1 hypothetical protein [Trichomonas vaginalis G3]
MRILNQLEEMNQINGLVQPDSPTRRPVVAQSALSHAKPVNPVKQARKNEVMQQALDINSGSFDDDSFSEPKGPSVIKRKNTVTEIPSFQGNESLFYRAEAICAFLEKEIGIDGLIDLKELIYEENDTPFPEHPIPTKYDPQIIVLTRQLLILDDLLTKV